MTVTQVSKTHKVKKQNEGQIQIFFQEEEELNLGPVDLKSSAVTTPVSRYDCSSKKNAAKDVIREPIRTRPFTIDGEEINGILMIKL